MALVGAQLLERGIDQRDLGVEHLQRGHQGPDQLTGLGRQGGLAQPCEKILGHARRELVSAGAQDAAHGGDILGPRLDQRASHGQLVTYGSPMGRQHVSERNAPALDGARQRLGIEAVILAAVLANAELTCSRGVDDQNVVAPVAELVVNHPGLAARLDRHPGRRGRRTEDILERVERADRAS
ncbi:hypothetical protein WMF04_11455 [Sorangium sp. So ce260]